ncbi:regulatory helix-turn-helix protein, lysR family [Rhizobium tibeticum]|uniref:HTH-type transcriptional regulator GltC n=1 Tax=Rhizobium tibeticum TaxID=501024 RepID=A0A1H8JSC9_9HYPH|nr:HTH-type transcriptional regulator GltC [Rhizobium tibeticum]SEN83643.1 regulatory helix-turn-helix protein, lysR family [Rhizobium tibeticum]
MQIRALMYFDELVRTNSMRQAAENLNVAPTAISRQIENLEYHFGAPLVERSARGVKLTAAVSCLLPVRVGRCANSITSAS